MPFQPAVNQELAIDGVTYRIAEHPAAPGMPYGQEGRAAIVYQLVASDGQKRALKVFKPRYRVPGLVGLAKRLESFADLPGLQVCRRAVLTPQRHAAILRQYPDLTYAVLMPWVEGPTWMEVVLGGQELSPQTSLLLAHQIVEMLVVMEQHSLAHCDISASNLLLPALAGGVGVALVDVEGMYGPELERPREIISGSLGYAHRTASQGVWGTEADRFAGAVLIAEVLGMCDGRIRQAAWGEHYFDPDEMQENSERYRLLARVVQERWGHRVADLLDRAWRSDTLADCPTFGEWLVALPEIEGKEVALPTTDRPPAPPLAVDRAEEAAPVRDPKQVLYRTLQEQMAQGLWEQAERTAQAIELLEAGYLDVPQLLRQAQDNRAGRQEVEEGWKQLTAELGEEENRLSGERALLEQQQETLAAERAGLASQQETLRQQRDELTAQIARVEKDLADLQARLVALDEQADQIERSYASLLESEQLLTPCREPLREIPQLLEARQYEQARLRLQTARAAWREARIARLQEMRCLQHIDERGRQHPVTSLAVTAQQPASLLVSATETGLLWVWDAATGKNLRTVQLSQGVVRSVAFSPDGQVLAAVGGDGQLWLLDTGSWFPKALPPVRGALHSVSFFPNGERLVAVGSSLIVLCKIREKRLWPLQQGGVESYRSCAVSPNGSLLAAGGAEVIRLWNLGNDKYLGSIKLPNSVESLAFSPDSGTLFSANGTDKVQLWRITNRSLLRQITIPQRMRARAIALSPDGQFLAVGTNEHTIYVLRTGDGAVLHTLTGHSDSVRGVVLLPDGITIASASRDGTVRLWAVP